MFWSTIDWYGDPGFKQNNDAYADVDTWVGSMDYGQLAADNVMVQLTTGAQTWAKLRDLIAASTVCKNMWSKSCHTLLWEHLWLLTMSAYMKWN